MQINDSGVTERVRDPGLFFSGVQKERYIVPGGGALALPLYQGDRVEVVDPEGLQQVQIAGFDEQGHSCIGRLGLTETDSGDTIAECLHAGDESARKMLARLERFNISLSDARVSSLLTGETPVNSSITFDCEEDVLGLIAAPGKPMMIEDPYPATDLIVYIRRARLQTTPHNFMLPEPLADPGQDIRIDKSTAVAYEVKKGEFIQIIDIEGRQCSDFQCFDKAGLEKGIEKCLDATTTRALTGSAYPGPGLYSRFYDVDFEPMLEVIQDTCGRHDSFGLACTRKYYEEAGYPGHVNCSDNFNRALSPYSIAPRKGWMAMNLFFNTFFNDTNQFIFDDPWSRPGDFVLLRALRDLVCVSSACPCDIDPANCWVPKDIHLRTYPEKNLFKRAIAFRKTADAEPEMTKETSFHKKTSQLTRNFVEYNGYWLANDFINYGAIAEYWACREKVIITDLSPLRKYEVIGPDAELLLQSCVTRDIRKLATGQVVYTAMCYESGGMIDDGTVFRLGKDNFRWIGGSDTSGLWLRQQAEERGLKAWVKDSTSQLHNLQVQGRSSRALLNDIIWTRPDQATVEELGVFRFSIARLHEANGIAILVSRTGYTGELGYEVFCHPDDAGAVWDAIWQTGQKYGITPLGLEALDMLRIEAGLIFAGQEFCDQTDPFESGIGFTVPLKSKQDDFIGRKALINRKENPQQKLTGLELVGEEKAASGDAVFTGREQIGTVTSGTVSPILRKNIALCKMKVQYCELGREIEIGKLDGYQKRIPAVISAFPHFDPKKERVKGIY